MENFISGYLQFCLIIVVIIIIGGGGIYLLLRPLILWYFKIYSLVSELQENNALLREIREELKKKNVQVPSSSQNRVDYSKYMPK